MNYRELMIGNLVSFKGMWKGEVDEITKGTIGIKGNGGCFPHDVFVGVPITEEWLVKLGFEKSSLETFFFGNDFKIEYDNHAGYGISFFGGAFLRGVEFVHEIQNIVFIITGTELTLTP